MTTTRRDLLGGATRSAGFAGAVAAITASVGPRTAFAAEPGGLTVDVRTFGAVGDGKTEDSAAIQRAIDSLPTIQDQAKVGGGTIAFPPGEFLLDRGIVLDHGVTLRGAGRKATVLAAKPDLQGPIIAFDRHGEPPSPDRVVISDLFVRGASVPGQTGVFFSNVHSWSISDAWIGWCDVGVHLVATWVGEFRNARATRNLAYGLRTEDSSDGGPNQIVFTASAFDRNEIGMFLDGSRYCWLFGCTLEGNDVGGLQVADGRNITVFCHFEANGRFDIALSPDPTVHRPTRNVVISGSTLSVSSEDSRVTGIVIGDAAQVDIRGNWFFKRKNPDSVGIGVELGNTSRDVLVCPRSNTFQGVDRTVAVRDGESLAASTVLNGGVLPLSLFRGWPELARFTREAFDLDDRRSGLDVLLDADVDGPIDLADVPAGTRLRGGPGRRTRVVRARGGHLGRNQAVIALPRGGQSVENLRVILDDAPEHATGLLLTGSRQAVTDVEVEHGVAAGIRIDAGAVGSVLRDVDCQGSGVAVDDAGQRTVKDNVVSGS